MTHAAQSELLRALAAIAGIAEAEMGATVCKRLNKQLQIIMESTPELTIDEMRTRYRMHRKFWPTCSVTVESLAKHWPELSGAPKLVPRDSEPVSEPEGWRASVTHLLEPMEPETARYIASLAWSNIAEHLRRTIVCRHTPSGDKIVPFQKGA